MSPEQAAKMVVDSAILNGLKEGDTVTLADRHESKEHTRLAKQELEKLGAIVKLVPPSNEEAGTKKAAEEIAEDPDRSLILAFKISGAQLKGEVGSIGWSVTSNGINKVSGELRS